MKFIESEIKQKMIDLVNKKERERMNQFKFSGKFVEEVVDCFNNKTLQIQDTEEKINQNFNNTESVFANEDDKNNALSN